MVKNVSKRSIQFPTKAIIQSDGWPQLPTVLCEQVDASAAHILALRRTLGVVVGSAEKISRIIVG
jgi:hypothetical protein